MPSCLFHNEGVKLRLLFFDLSFVWEELDFSQLFVELGIMKNKNSLGEIL